MAGQLWMTNTLGGFMYADELSEVLRLNVQPLVKFRQFCDAKDATDKGLNVGENYHWNIYSDIASQGGTLVETNTMPESNFTITQGTLTITEYGNSVPYTAKLDNLSKHPVTEIIKKVLRHDAKKAFDIAGFNQFNATLLRFVGTGADQAVGGGVLTEDGTATATNNKALGKEDAKIIIDTMKERNVPPYALDDYFCLGHPTTFRPFKNDLETIHQYTDPGLQLIMNGEVGRFESTRYVEQTFIPKGGAADSGTFDPVAGVADAWDNAKSSWAFYFGEDTVAEALAIPEEMRGKLPGDYGRSKGVAWYYMGGFGLVHAATASQGRIVKWDSAS